MIQQTKPICMVKATIIPHTTKRNSKTWKMSRRTGVVARRVIIMQLEVDTTILATVKTTFSTIIAKMVTTIEMISKFKIIMAAHQSRRKQRGNLTMVRSTSTIKWRKMTISWVIILIIIRRSTRKRRIRWLKRKRKQSLSIKIVIMASNKRSMLWEEITSAMCARLNWRVTKKSSIHVIASIRYVISAIIIRLKKKRENVPIAENIMKLAA